MSTDVLQVIDLWKVYSGITALRDVSLGFRPGRVQAIIGKNGAGKSSLIKILSGAIQPTRGRILLRGQEVKLHSPREAHRLGIATVYQELSLLPELSVGENVLLGRLPHRRGNWVVDWRATFDQARAMLERLGMPLDVRRKVGTLSMAQRQVVEIARAMMLRPAVLMLDEPTSTLTHEEVGQLFGMIRQLTAQGVAVIYISHRLQELNEIADSITVLRDGALVGRLEVQEATPQTIAHMMFGEIQPQAAPPPLTAHTEPVLEVRNLTRRRKFTNISFTLHRGEVLGLAGMLGSGRTELLRAIFGAEPFDGGEVWLGGRTLRHPDPHASKSLGLAMTQENRKDQGLVMTMNIMDNLCLAGLRHVARRGLIWKGRQRRMVRDWVESLQIKAPNLEDSIASLSGGNQQKVVLGNWLMTRPRVMFLDEPTRGIDVQAKQQIFQIIRRLSAAGLGCIFVSSELEELLEVCHRLLILRGGRMIGEVSTTGLELGRLFEMVTEGGAA